MIRSHQEIDRSILVIQPNELTLGGNPLIRQVIRRRSRDVGAVLGKSCAELAEFVLIQRIKWKRSELARPTHGSLVGVGVTRTH